MLDFRQYSNHSDEITSLYQVSSAARCNSFTIVRRAAACGGVAPAARGPGAAAPSRACAGAGCRPRCWPSGCARGAVLVAPLRGACARPCPLRRRAARPRALWCFGRCGGLAFRSAGGRAPRAVAPSLRGARLLALGLLRFASAAGALLLRGRASLRSPPSRSPAAAVGASVAARRARSLAPAARRRLRRRRRSSAWGRRGAPPGPLFPRLSALGACAASFPLRVARRLSPLRGFGLGRPRRASAPLRRGPAAGRPRGARRGPLRRAPSWGARAPPAWGLGLAPLRRRFFRGCCGALLSRAARRGLASPALLVRLAFGRGFLRTLTAALQPRGLFAPSAHLLFNEKVSCKSSRKAQHIVSAVHLIYHIQANSAKLELFCRIAGTPPSRDVFSTIPPAARNVNKKFTLFARIISATASRSAPPCAARQPANACQP